MPSGIPELRAEYRRILTGLEKLLAGAEGLDLRRAKTAMPALKLLKMSAGARFAQIAAHNAAAPVAGAAGPGAADFEGAVGTNSACRNGMEPSIPPAVAPGGQPNEAPRARGRRRIPGPRPE